MVYDSDVREANVTGLETATPLVEYGAASPGAFVVPTNVKRITELRFTAGMSSADDTAFGFLTAFHIYGGGVDLKEGWFPGPRGISAAIAAASGDRIGNFTQDYLTNIPVLPGGQFAIDAFMLGEDVGALQMLADVVYDGPVVGRIRDMDYRSIDLASANTPVTLTERGAAVVEGDIRPPYDVIGELFLGAGATITAGAATVAGITFEMSGAGLMTAGNYRFLDKLTWGGSTELAANTKIFPLSRYICGIKVKRNNPIRVQAQMIEGDIGTAYSQVAFGYY